MNRALSRHPPGTAFARLRRRTALVDVDSPATRKGMARNQVINVVDEADGEMTVGGLAYQLTVDSSVASRMVSDRITAGLLVRVASQSDGRRTVLRLSVSRSPNSWSSTRTRARNWVRVRRPPRIAAPEVRPALSRSKASPDNG
ncbi:hypothetical protein [Streptomyces liangshanensis]|uniref:hypothetical protein n=1 Tax=Streptomyces liangshanensis TaxID=2717324 RepID=UPI0036DDFDD2